MKKEKIISSADCEICSEIKTGRFPDEYRMVYPVINRVCFETSFFVVFPSISPLTPGHILVAPKRHVNCLVALNEIEKKELIEVVEKFYGATSSEEKGSYFFEHGVAEQSMAACGINHAHLHLLPMDSISVRKIDEVVSSQYKSVMSGPLQEILSKKKIPQTYLLFGRSLLSVNFSPQIAIPSQYMRNVISDVLGYERRNWRELSGEQDFMETLDYFWKNNVGSSDALVDYK